MKNCRKKIISYLICSALLICMYIPASAAGKVGKDITDLVYCFRQNPKGSNAEMRKILREIKAEDENLGTIWENIMGFWVYSKEDQVSNTGSLPSGLPDDDSLCFITMGFKLNPDGSMNPELKERCDIALKCARQYPEAYIAVTGGGTAENTVKKTEADVMHDYMVENGLDSRRIIVENRSLTTCENALYLGERIINDYPSISSLVIVTSDYHVPESSLMFREYMYLSHHVGGSRNVQVVSNLSYKTDMFELADTVSEESPYVWSIAETFKVIGT